MVSSRSSVPSSAKYDDWMGIRRWVEATSALMVSRPRAGGQSITTWANCPFSAASSSFSRNGASSSPTSRDSSLARAIRAGAIDKLGNVAGTITSARCTVLSTKTSYMLRVAVRMSMNDMLLLPCGSRSMSSVGLPRMARAAARLMAVVVFPTPPFWLAILRIIEQELCGFSRILGV